MFGVTERWRKLCETVERELRDCGRQANETSILCVTKTQDALSIEPLLEAGARHFGENRVQEAQTKWPQLKARFPDAKLHLIGPLQTNKAEAAAKLFDVVETLDRPKLAEAFVSLSRRGIRLPEFFVQINTGSEPQKSGVEPRFADEFINLCRELHHLPVVGLMCIPPANEQAAPHFALLQQIARRNGITQLSMGMTSDYRIAIQLGSTEVRLGSAIFGQRR